MFYPTLTPEEASRDFIDVFGGYNHNARIGDNEFYDMKNMTSAYYPAIGSRQMRGSIYNITTINKHIVGMLYRSDFYFVTITAPSGSPVRGSLELYKIYDGQPILVRAFAGVLPQLGEHKLIMMGAYMVIMPEGVYVNLSDGDYGVIDAEVSTDASSTSVLVCDKDGNAAQIDYVGDSEPQNPIDGYMWLDVSEDTPLLKRYYGANAMWVADATQYIKITGSEGSELAKNFSEGDAVTLSGITIPSLSDLNNITILKNKPDDNTFILNARVEKIEGIYTRFEVVKVINGGIGAELKCLDSDAIIEDGDYRGKKFLIKNQKATCLSNTDSYMEQGWVVSASTMMTNRKNYVVTQNQTQLVQATTGNIDIHITLESGETLNAATNNPVFFEGVDSDTYIADNKYISNGSDNIGPYIRVSGAGSSILFPPNTKIYPMEYGDVPGTTCFRVNFSKKTKVHTGDIIILEPDFVLSQQTSITISRKMPLMDHVIESGNRLWGCRYGENAEGDYVNEIYASKQGDFKNWQCYEGIASDSFAASCGTEGDWTGAISYLGRPVFFKENYIHTVYGSYPAQFQIDSVAARGVQNGSANSLAILNETLFYMSPEGVCTYNGSLPVNISGAFGTIKYHDALGCAYNDKYYVEMLDASNDPILMVFDSKRNLWHKEDNERITAISAAKDDVYYLGENTQKLKSLYGVPDNNEEIVSWFVVTGINGLSMIDSKYISKLNIRLSLEQNAYAVISIQYDNSDVWERLYNVVRKSINPFTIPIKPKRCDHFRLKIEGKGGVRIHSISKTISQGSDRAWT